MRTLAYARARGREHRALINGSPDDLIPRVTRYLWEEFRIHMQAVAPKIIPGSRGEVSPGGRVLKYNERLSDAELREVLAHELGHLVLHERLTDDDAPHDPILGSAYADEGPGAVARYSPRGFEEAQAQAFATEFLCPSDELFAHWRRDPAATSASLAAAYGVSVALVRVQLAHALHDLALGGSAGAAAAPRTPVECDESQLEAAHFRGRPALVDAGPGTGKTATLVERVRFALEECGAHPRQILVLTFSNEAARELRERIAGRFGQEVADQITAATFHGFGMAFLHHHGHHVGVGTTFTLLDEDGVRELVTGVLGRAPCDRLVNLRDIDETVAAVAKHIEHCKDRLRDHDALAAALAAWTPAQDDTTARGARAAAEEFLGLFRAYERAKHDTRRVDFADLVLLPVRVLERQATVAAAYREKYPWVLVDEFQDVSRATSRLLRHLCGAENPPWVVGDARQAIYRFRGAAPENVREFAADFPDTERFDLAVNYRSSAPVVRAANELAALMEAPDGATPAPEDVRERWRPGRPVAPLGATPVQLALAESDYAERQGLADQVRAWLAEGTVAPGDVAVLARRNVDVRAIVLALAERGIRAAASGLLTPEGAAGDLAAVATVLDAPTASLPRLAYALGRAQHSTRVLNAAVTRLLAELRMADSDAERAATSTGGAEGSGEPAVPGMTAMEPEVAELVETVRRVHAQLGTEAATADGFALLTAFLFDDGAYLRRVLGATAVGPEASAPADAPEGDGISADRTATAASERGMALVEIVSALSEAVAYRLTHPASAAAGGSSAAAARIGFGARLRGRLTKAAPVPVAPTSRPGAVRVMTCHASKGLEFPCAVVAGQTVPAQREVYAWLPPEWRPTATEEREQADALLFVGVTRGQRAVLVSYPMSAGGGERGRAKEAVPLLARWQALAASAAVAAPLVWRGTVQQAPEVCIGATWGGAGMATLPLSAVDEKACMLQTYVESVLGARFPVPERPLYPAFVAVTRRVMRAVVHAAAAGGRLVDAIEADHLFDESWPAAEYADHPHAEIYRTTARRMVRGFAEALGASLAAGATVLDPEIAVAGGGPAPAVRLDLVGHVQHPDGRVEAIAFRPEPLDVGRGGAVNWSTLSSKKRLSFVLLERASPGIVPRVYSGADGTLRAFKWSQRTDSLPKETSAVVAQLDAFGRGEFTTVVKPYTCDGCRVRVACPYWVGASEGVGEAPGH